MHALPSTAEIYYADLFHVYLISNLNYLVVGLFEISLSLLPPIHILDLIYLYDGI